jgi:hypothetical protein
MNLLLPIGISSVGGVLGLMVGASATPVVSVAVPTIFALAAAAIGVVQSSRVNKETAEAIKVLRKDPDTASEIAPLLAELRVSSSRLGVLLVAFSCFYLAGVVVGAKARIADWLTDAQVAPPLPWASGKNEPPDIDAALQWIVLQHKLRKLGYSDAAVGLLYDVQTKEWARLPAPAPAQASAPAAAAAAAGPAARAPVASDARPSTPAHRKRQASGPGQAALGQKVPPAPASSAAFSPAAAPIPIDQPQPPISKVIPPDDRKPGLSDALDPLLLKPLPPLADHDELRRKQWETKG